MSVKLRLARHGTTNAPFYWVVAADSRFARDGRYLEKLGIYNPMLGTENPERLKVNRERVKYWLSVGATPSDRVIKLFQFTEVGELEKFTKKKKSVAGKDKTVKNPDKRKKKESVASGDVAKEEVVSENAGVAAEESKKDKTSEGTKITTEDSKEGAPSEEMKVALEQVKVLPETTEALEEQNKVKQTPEEEKLPETAPEEKE